ncbi:unnamed protein product [Brassicogethes aeneus]|uniref:BED-type domain-containing protein n=1 Tax=Brassicogethes aeneus TaxID=1431903 RepID=A0A9P0AYM0_BRAAE|nr:unnamed protein product [Brassicogethes aeneus]
MTGRRKDPIWQHFIQVAAKAGSKSSFRAQCKNCKTEIVPLVVRMKKHINICRKSIPQVSDTSETDSEDISEKGYQPPNRHKIGNELLCSVYDSLYTVMKKELANKTVCMSIEGWSNIRNDSIVCVSVTDIQEKNGNVYLIDTIDTEDKSHTSEYLLSLLVESIKRCRTYNCTAQSVVTDNAANMTKMRGELAKSEEVGLPDILTYGCSAHILNLLAQDI